MTICHFLDLLGISFLSPLASPLLPQGEYYRATPTPKGPIALLLSCIGKDQMESSHFTPPCLAVLWKRPNFVRRWPIRSEFLRQDYARAEKIRQVIPTRLFVWSLCVQLEIVRQELCCIWQGLSYIIFWNFPIPATMVITQLPDHYFVYFVCDFETSSHIFCVCV